MQNPSSLKQKIEQMFEKYGMTELHFKLPMLANLYDDVVGLLDEATKQFLAEFDAQACRCDDDSLCAAFEEQGEDCKECGIFALRKWVKEQFAALDGV